MGDPDEIYDMADEDATVDTESVVSPRDLIKKLNAQNADMATRRGGPPPKAMKPPVMPKDIKKTQAGLKPVDSVKPKTSPTPTAKENNRNLSNTSPESGSIANELAAKLAARRKFSENDKGGESIAAGLAKALPEFEKKRSQSDSSNMDFEKPPKEVRPVEVMPKQAEVPHKRPPAPLPKKVTLPPAAGTSSPKPAKPDSSTKPTSSSPTAKHDTNNNLHNEINKRKHENKFEIIAHEGCKYFMYKLSIIEGSKPRRPFRTADIKVPAKYLGDTATSKKAASRSISFIEPTASDEEEDEVKPPPIHRLLPQVSVKGIPLTSTADDEDGELYDDTELAGAPPDDEAGELYEEFDPDEMKKVVEKTEEEKKQEEKLEKQRAKEEKKKAKELEKEKKRKQKEEQEKQKLLEKYKEKYKLDGNEQVQFTGKAKEKISRVFETLFEKGDNVPVVRMDEKVNPKGKWLVQLKDGKYEYVDLKLIEREVQAAASATDYDEENIYEGEEYDEGFSGVIEEDIYEEM